MGPIQVVVEDGNNLVLEVTPTPDTTVILDRGIAGPPGPAGTGDVNGPASSTDNAVARFDGTTGKLIQNSAVTINDAGAIAGVTDLSLSGSVTLSGGTANGVAYLNGSKVLTTGSALTFDGTNLGVGASPTFYGGQVATAGSIAITGGSLLKLWNTGGTGVGGISSPGTDTLAFGLGSGFTEQMRLTSTGLGIGTSSPAFKLDVNGVGAVRAGNAIRYYRTDNAIYTELYDAGSSGFTLNNANGNGFRFQLAGSTQATLDSAGNLGLGVTSPGDKLEIGGSGSGIILASPNGTRYRITVSNLGVLTVTAV